MHCLHVSLGPCNARAVQLQTQTCTHMHAGVTRPSNYLQQLDKLCTKTCDAAVTTYQATCAANGFKARQDGGRDLIFQ